MPMPLPNCWAPPLGHRLGCLSYAIKLEAEMAGTTLTGTTVAGVMAELAELEDPKARAVNEKHGDDHGVNLGKLRAIAKRLKTQQKLALELWATSDTAARLLAILIC